jgi:toxin CcdB
VAQFSVHVNLNPASRGLYPFLLDIQSELLNDLNTRVVVPLAPPGSRRGPSLAKLMPKIRVDGVDYVMLTPQLAGIPVRHLGYEVENLADNRAEIVAALDLLVSGI